MASLKQRLLNVAIAVDQLVYVLVTLGSGSPDETMSAAAYRLERKGRLAGRIFRPMLDAIFFWDAEHCRASFMSEVSRRQLDPDYLTTDNGAPEGNRA